MAALSEVVKNRTNHYDKSVSTPKECLYFATGNIEGGPEVMCGAGSAATPGTPGGDFCSASTFRLHDEHRTYEVPFLVTKVSGGQGSKFPKLPNFQTFSFSNRNLALFALQPKNARAFSNSSVEALYSYPSRSRDQVHHVTKSGGNLVVRMWPPKGSGSNSAGSPNDYESVRAHYGSSRQLEHLEPLDIS